MAYTKTRTNKRKARKQHQCQECKKYINPGEVYRHIGGFSVDADNGFDAIQYKQCLDCAKPDAPSIDDNIHRIINWAENEGVSVDWNNGRGTFGYPFIDLSINNEAISINSKNDLNEERTRLVLWLGRQDVLPPVPQPWQKAVLTRML